MLFHGTTHKFEKFDLSGGNSENHVGIGVYLTDSVYDCEEHYATDCGPDLKNRIGMMADRLCSEDEDLCYSLAYDIASKALVGPVRRILTCTIKPEAKLLPLGKHYVELYDYGSEPDDEIQLTKFGAAIDAVLTGCGYSASDIISDGEMRTDEILQELAKTLGDDDISYGETFKEIVILAGYDGIVYDDVSDWFKMCEKYTKHFVVYNPELVEITSTEDLE